MSFCCRERRSSNLRCPISRAARATIPGVGGSSRVSPNWTTAAIASSYSTGVSHSTHSAFVNSSAGCRYQIALTLISTAID